MPAGRPSKYSKALQAKADKYVECFADLGDVLPTIEGLAIHLNLHRDTIDAWKNDPKKPAFSDTIENLMQRQKKLLLEKGLLSEYNATMAKLGLSANHGMHDKEQRDHNHNHNFSEYTDEQLAERVRELIG